MLSFDLEKGESALGVSIVNLEIESSGGHGIFIKEIQPDSVAYRYKLTLMKYSVAELN